VSTFIWQGRVVGNGQLEMRPRPDRSRPRRSCRSIVALKGGVVAFAFLSGAWRMIRPLPPQAVRRFRKYDVRTNPSDF